MNLNFSTVTTGKDAERYHELSGFKASEQSRSYLLLKDDQGEILGGCELRLNYDFLVVESIWTHESVRARGLGVNLYEQAEEFARDHRCRKILLSTLKSQQALSFWQRLGFEIAGEVKDCPAGDTLYYLFKDL